MKKEFWLEKWQNQQIGFHLDFTHPLLVQYLQQLKLKQGDEVFVPLCGKSLDMLWMSQQGFKVFGVELSAVAIEGFFSENKLHFVKSKHQLFDVYQHHNIHIYQGDFFDLTQSMMKNVKAIYDRAALIALPDEMVKKYVEKMLEIIPSGVRQLLITLEFNKTSGSIGPPFSTNEAKVKRLYEKLAPMQLLQEKDIIAKEEKFQQQGCDYLYERAYLIQHC